MDDYLTKPLDRARLAETLSRHFADPASGQPPALTGERVSPRIDCTDEPVDWIMLMEVADGDTEFAEELIDTFIHSGDLVLAQIRDAVERGDLDAISRSAHSLKGASANIRAAPLSSVAAELEEAARAGALERVVVLHQQLGDASERTVAYLRQRRA